ncbi:MAG: 3-isopropylmalate dehydrogenase [Clostridiales bacterium]|jgi:3-isopropylmalate dehydrogenase|nr:3-isopropylmalate dehydrogenase [Clostridiales bacterium]
MNLHIAVLPGDGIGPEVTAGAVQVINAVAQRFDHSVTFTQADVGGASIDRYGTPLSQECLTICEKADSIILGAVGGSKWDSLPGELRPEAGLLGLRKHFELYANLRPVLLFDELRAACPLKPEFVKNGIDIMIVRELTGGMYFGKRGRIDTPDVGRSESEPESESRSGSRSESESESGSGSTKETYAFDTEAYSALEIRRIAITAFEAARLRKRRLTNVDKANVLESSRLWREIINSVKDSYPDVSLEHLYVDNASMQLIKRPSSFDVIVTSNMFGDILSDEASQIVGSIGVLPSASLGAKGKLFTFGMYEPAHGSAPDIAGKDIANPIAAILSAAMMFRYSFGLQDEASAIESAVKRALAAGFRTADIALQGENPVGTTDMTATITSFI